ncbi:MAG: glycoside hydrolase TIM-barrel-like domain-containing protein [Rickettsiales bacterium]
MLYPMLFVDQIKPEAKPWRGRIKPGNSDAANNWFTRHNGYNRFITHYANLTKGQVEAFVIGSELVGMTNFKEDSGNFPAVNKLVNLAATVKHIVGSSTKVTYAADWSEYHHSTNGWYNLDPLWSSPHIDFVGIDAYFPLTEDLPQSQITERTIIESWEKGEGWDYYCDSDRSKKVNFTGFDYAWKNLEHWWTNKHYNPDGQVTEWQPKMKPVWFCEIGFPSVDACANQPNVFYDPSSKESFFPRNSRSRINFQAQREALNASLDYLQTRNKMEGKADLVPKSFVWCWDARPFSFWPDLEGVWKDSMLWATGHWVNGKLGNSTLGAIVGELFQLSGLSKSDYDVTRLTETVEGYIILHPITVRNALEQLACSYFFETIESDGILKCVSRGGSSCINITQDDLVPTDKNGVADVLEIVRAQELELPQRVNVTYIDRPFNYDPVTVTAQRQTVKAVEQVMLNLPLVMNDTLAKKIADVTLYGAWKERVSFVLTLPPKYVRVEPTDIITVIVEDNTYQMRVVKTDMERNGLMKIAAVAEDISSYDFHSNTKSGRSAAKPPELIPDTILELLDLPPLPGDQENQPLLRIAVAGNGDDWNGSAIYSSNDGGEQGGNNFTPLAGIDTSATMGIIITELAPSQSVTWDEYNTVEVVLFSGSLISVSELALLNGANAAMIGDELIQFQTQI